AALRNPSRESTPVGAHSVHVDEACQIAVTNAQTWCRPVRKCCHPRKHTAKVPNYRYPSLAARLVRPLPTDPARRPLPEKGKPVVRRGRKATGRAVTGWLPGTA